MDRSSKIGLSTVWSLAMFIGCGESSTPEPSVSNARSGAPTVAVAADPATDPVAKAAFDFLDAVLKGDTQRAGAQLTPAAMQRFVENGDQFAPPGIDQATFRIGEVRKPSETQALVQCILTANTPAGEKSEEMCCLMKLVDNTWRVSGIAYSAGPQRSPMILDFENPPQAMVPKAPLASDNGSGQSGAPVSPGRPSPPRTAQETPAGTLR